MKKKNKKPWPTRAVMAQIYEKNLWGGEEGEFYSGSGSHHPDLVGPYLKQVGAFLTSREEALTIVDLGCGDFNVGSQLVKYAKKYIAVDIVPELIERNRNMYSKDHLEFHCLDLAKDELPAGDCAILRNVLQHVSNAEIARIVPKLGRYKYIILTEHVPDGNFIPNLDIISGQGIRLKKGSGVDLTAAPFRMKFRDRETLLSLPSRDGNGKEKTVLFTNI